MKYLDLIILGILILLVIFSFRSFKSFIYFLGITDLFLRIIHFIATHVHITKITPFLENNFPSSIISIIDKYTKGILNNILVWLFVILMVIWFVYLLIYFIKKRK